MNDVKAPKMQVWSGAERRAPERDNALIALTRLLEAVRRRAEVDALTVSDSEGCLVAGSGAADLCDELAASAPLLVRAPANDTKDVQLENLARRSAVRKLALDGVTVLISAHGEHADLGVQEIAAGTERILRAAGSSF